MLDLARVVGFDWDDGNTRKSLDKHGVTQQEAEQVFLDPRLRLLVDETHSIRESRFHAYGTSEGGRKLQVSFTLREDDTLIRVISTRPMSRKERAVYDQEEA
jgi:uncharacterized DUF497 family protein